MAITPTKKTDEELMQLYIGGSYESFEALYSRYKSRVYGYIMNQTSGNRALSDDIFQTVFSKFHQNRDKYNSEYMIKAWIFTICKNTIRDQFRKERVEKNYIKDNDTAELEKINTEEEVSFRQIREITKLEDEKAEILRLRIDDEYKFDEIAKLLNRNTSSVRQIYHRTIKQLRTTLSKNNTKRRNL